jgi:hypothetical protein
MRVFPIGIPVEGEQKGTGIGTLTCYGVPRGSPGTQVLITANHVLGRNGANLSLGSPSLGSCPSCCLKNVFAHAFVDGKQGNVGAPGEQSYVDCAMASLEPGVQGLNRFAGLQGKKRDTGEFLGAFLAGVGMATKGEPVTVATKSGPIPGTVLEVTAGSPTSAFNVPYKFNMLIATDKKYWKTASEGSGDSGAAVINQFNEVIGLMHARASTSPDVDMDVLPLIVACHMKIVIDFLNVDIKPDWESIPAAGAVLHEVPLDGPDLMQVQPAQRGAMLQHYESRLRATPLGREMLDAGLLHGPEMGRLVHHCRPVLVAWHRSQGPAWAAHLLNRAQDPNYQMPREVKGISRRALLDRMRHALCQHGSPQLREQLDRFYDPVLALSEVSDADELFALLGAMRPG